jgi:hypothetical protein
MDAENIKMIYILEWCNKVYFPCYACVCVCVYKFHNVDISKASHLVVARYAFGKHYFGIGSLLETRQELPHEI